MDRLRTQARKLSFFAAVRRLDAVAREHKASRDQTGASDHPVQDPVRFCQDPALWFSGRALERLEDQAADHPARLFVNFLGLLGPNGPLPLHITEYIHEREHNFKDATLARFLDMFNHRMLSLFYRAWAVNQMTVSRDRGGDDSFARFVGSLAGLGFESLKERDAVPDDAKLFYAGHMASGTMHPDGLKAILADFFQVEVSIREFVGLWVAIPERYWLRLGRTTDTATLGRTAVLGSKVFECSQKFRILLGPLTFRNYQRLLPGTRSFRRLHDWARLYTTDELQWDCCLVLDKAEVPATELGRVGRLGWNTWLKSEPFANHASDLVVEPEVAGRLAEPDPAVVNREITFAAKQRRDEEAALAAADLFDAPVAVEAPVEPKAAAAEPAETPVAEEPEIVDEEEVLEELPDLMELPLEGTAGEEELHEVITAMVTEESELDLEPEEDLPVDIKRMVDQTLLHLEETPRPDQPLPNPQDATQKPDRIDFSVEFKRPKKPDKPEKSEP